MRNAFILGLATVLVCTGCVSTRPQPRLATFDPAEYAPFERSGTGSIVGQAFMVTKGGDVKLAAGREVIVNPVTSYSTEWYDRMIVGYTTLEDSDPSVRKFSKVVTADGEGRFRFDGLVSGEYYVVCWINWYITEYQQAGGIAHAKVKVEDGKVSDVVVTRQ